MTKDELNESRFLKYDRPEIIARELRAKAALIDDRNKGGQLKEITDDMRVMAFRLDRYLTRSTAPNELAELRGRIEAAKIAPLTYLVNANDHAMQAGIETHNAAIDLALAEIDKMRGKGA